jgi:hypothetical protein
MRLKPKPLDKKALRRSFFSAFSRLVGTMMAAGAGSLLYQTLGSSTSLAVGIASTLAAIGFFLIWVFEYEREIDL